jgi:lactoylglutathione lyase
MAARILKDRGIAVSEPVYHAWMKAVSVYFNDPDGHSLELLAFSPYLPNHETNSEK